MGHGVVVVPLFFGLDWKTIQAMREILYGTVSLEESQELEMESFGGDSMSSSLTGTSRVVSGGS